MGAPERVEKQWRGSRAGGKGNYWTRSCSFPARCSCRDTVALRKTRYQCGWIWRIPRCPLDDPNGPIAPAMPVDVFTEPGSQRAEIPSGKRILERTNRTLGCVEELRRVHVAECISREVSDEPFRPVYVLKAP